MANVLAANTTTNYKILKVLAWAGPVYVVCEACSWGIIGKFLPPPAEYLTPEQVFAFYTDHNLSIRVGMMLTLLFAPLYYVWAAVVSKVMSKAEGPDGVLSTLELLGGFATVMVTFGAVVPWLSASFDTDLKSVQDIKALNDQGWMWFNPTAMVTIVQFVAFGTGFLFDRRPVPLIPRWMSWFSYAMTVTLALALLTPFFHRGPFAWHGLFTYYVGLGGFFLWIGVACYHVIKAVGKLEAEARAS